MIYRHLVLPTLLIAFSFQAAHAIVVAHWQFEEGTNFLLDSSGNGYHLEAGHAGFAAPVYSSDKPASVASGGSAQFDGANFVQTVTPLALNTFNWVRFSYWLQVESTSQPQTDMIVLENSFDSNFQVNVGSTFHLANATGGGRPPGTMLLAYRTGPGFPPVATTLDDGTYGTAGEWHHIQVDYKFDEPNPDDRVRMWVNGALAGKTRSIGGDNWERLRDDLLYIGARREFGEDPVPNPTLFFVGKLADVRIEVIPEPQTLGLIAVASVTIVLWSRRRGR